MRSTGASAFFVVVYLHIFRAPLYGSYKQPRELLWVLGMLVYLALMAEAFMGYVLPWGNMSFWGAQALGYLGLQPAEGKYVIVVPRMVLLHESVSYGSCNVSWWRSHFEFSDVKGS